MQCGQWSTWAPDYIGGATERDNVDMGVTVPLSHGHRRISLVFVEGLKAARKDLLDDAAAAEPRVNPRSTPQGSVTSNVAGLLVDIAKWRATLPMMVSKRGNWEGGDDLGSRAGVLKDRGRLRRSFPDGRLVGID